MASTAYTPFSKRPLWKDVVPIPQDDGPAPVVAINYTPQFTDTMNYFRAVLASDERSQRALDLTSEVIKLNSANYTAWRFRRLCLYKIGSQALWKLEFNFMRDRLEENPKNYQIWFHRQRVVLQLKDYSREKADLKTVFKEDAKNYHAWTHRQWVVRTFGLWDGELEFIDEFLKLDVRNNSLWNHRWFVVTKLMPMEKMFKAVVLREIHFALKHIPTAIHNDAAWSYLSGFLRGRSLSDFPTVAKALEEIKVKYAKLDVIPMLALFFDLAVAEGSAEAKAHASKLCDKLAAVDVARKKYWNMCKAECSVPVAPSVGAAESSTAGPVGAAASSGDGIAVPPEPKPSDS